MNQRSECAKHQATWEGTFTILRETDAALLLWDGTGTTDDAQWVPRSQIHQVNKTNTVDVVEVLMSEWIAKNNGFI